LNDPINMHAYEDLAPHVYYSPHAYDPDVHKPGKPYKPWIGDVGWVGTTYPSRREFMRKVDWSGLKVRLGGNWSWVDADDVLPPYLIHKRKDCLDNEDTVLLYQSVKATFNTYRKEAQHEDLELGWAIGPREVEACATGLLLAREPRGEGDDLLKMCPTFTEPEELGELLRWWCANDGPRERVIAQAREAIADRTFENHAKKLLTILEDVPAFAN